MQVGIDLGGTKIEIIALDDKSILFNKRIPTPQGQYRATLDAIGYLVNACEKHCHKKISKIGIGIPGAVSPDTGLIKNANSTCLIGQHLAQDLAALLKIRVEIANDADCFTLSEAVDGAAQNSHIVFGVILGTGVGGGIVINQQLLNGPNAITGEWGHNPMPNSEPEIRECYCGKHNCIETFLSGPGFAKAFNQVHTSDLSAPEIWSQANKNAQAENAVKQYIDHLARALSTVINIVDPDVIVLGGGLSNQTRIYAELPTLLEKYVFSDVVNTLIVPAKYGDASGVRGAAWLS